MNRIKFSDEQLDIINDNTNNIIVNAVAGSGKTTTIMGICEKNSDKNVLVLTYNNLLAKESNVRKMLYGIKNCDIYTFHGFCTRYYDTCYDDQGIDKIVVRNTPSRNNVKYDIIIIDETQDVDPYLFKMAVKIIKEHTKGYNRIIVLGDYFQCIYKNMKNSNGKYLSHIDDIFANTFNNNPWKRYSLNTSYRCTQQICSLVRIFSHGKINMISSKKRSDKQNVIYQYSKYHKTAQDVVEIIRDLIRFDGYIPDDFYILIPSIDIYTSNHNKRKKISQQIGDKLTEYGINWYVNKDRNMESYDETKNKVCINTFYTIKGSERKVVFIVGFDDSYYKYYKKCRIDCKGSCDICKSHHKLDNELYVALTRSSDLLYIIHGDTKNHLDFVDTTKLKLCCDIVGNWEPKTKTISEEKDYYKSVSYYCKYLNYDFIKTLGIDDLFEIEKTIGTVIDTPNLVKQEETVENVSQILGVAAPLFYHHSWNENELDYNFIKSIRELYYSMKANDVNKKYDIYNINFDEISNFDILRIAAMLIYKIDKYKNIYAQINKFDFVTQEIVKKIVDNIDYLGCINKYDSEKEYRDSRLHIIGIVDMLYTIENKNFLVEFKFTSETTISHKIQLLFYKYLYELNNTNEMEYQLYNIKKGILYNLKPISKTKTKEIIEKIVTYRNMGNLNVSIHTDEFIKINKEIVKTIYNNNEIDMSNVIQDPIFEDE